MLDKRDRAGLCDGETGFSGQMRGNGPINDTQYLAHDGGVAGKQKAQRKGHAEHPLTLGLS